MDNYRTRLQTVDPQACRDVDEVMCRVGHSWVCDETIVDPDELVTTKDIEDRYGITANAIRILVHTKGIPNRGRLGRFKIYRLGDILEARYGK